MILTLELTPEEETRLQANASVQGVEPAALVRSLIASLPDAQKALARAQYEATTALFAQWKEEDEARLGTMIPEQIAAEDAQWDEIMRNIQQNRVDFPIPDVADHD